MTIRANETSPQVYARLSGLLYLSVIVAGIIAQMGISGQIIVDGDATATANNILTHTDLFQLGFTIYMIEMTCQVGQTILFYVLLKPVQRNLALFALAFGLIGCIIKTFSRLFYIAPLLVLGNAQYLSVFSTEQLQALSLLLLGVNDRAAAMALAFFGFSTLLNGYLVFKSAFLPQVLGALSMVGGLGWLTFLYPPLGYQLLPYLLPIALLGSAAQIVWLLIKGVHVTEWMKRAQIT